MFFECEKNSELCVAYYKHSFSCVDSERENIKYVQQILKAVSTSKRRKPNRWNEFFTCGKLSFLLSSLKLEDHKLNCLHNTSFCVQRSFPLTSCNAFLSIVLLLCSVLMTFFAPSTTAASILSRWRSSSMRSSSDDSSCSCDRISPFSAAVCIFFVEQSLEKWKCIN